MTNASTTNARNMKAKMNAIRIDSIVSLTPPPLAGAGPACARVVGGVERPELTSFNTWLADGNRRPSPLLRWFMGPIVCESRDGGKAAGKRKARSRRRQRVAVIAREQAQVVQVGIPIA